MKSSAQVVVIGGGVVGASVLYHLTEMGWTVIRIWEHEDAVQAVDRIIKVVQASSEISDTC